MKREKWKEKMVKRKKERRKKDGKEGAGIKNTQRRNGSCFSN